MLVKKSTVLRNLPAKDRWNNKCRHAFQARCESTASSENTPTVKLLVVLSFEATNVSEQVGCVVVDLQSLEVIFTDDLQDCCVFDSHENNMPLLFHGFDKTLSVPTFRARRTGFTHEVGPDPDVVVFRHDVI